MKRKISKKANKNPKTTSEATGKKSLSQTLEITYMKKITRAEENKCNTTNKRPEENKKERHRQKRPLKGRHPLNQKQNKKQPTKKH